MSAARAPGPSAPPTALTLRPAPGLVVLPRVCEVLPPVANKPADLSIVVLSFNVKGFLQQALRTLTDASQGLDVEIFVVDNDSSDGSAEMVESMFPRVRLIRSRNLGFAGGNNLALPLCQGRYVLLINPDTVVLPDTLKVMVRFLDGHPEAGAAGCKLLNPDGTLQLGCHRGFPTPVAAFSKIVGLSALFPQSRIFGAYNLTYLDPDQVHEVDALSGSFMMVRRQILDTVGLLDERFFMNGEDLDWCYRIQRAGWKIYYVPDTEIIHFKGQSQKLVSRYRELLWFYHAMHLFVKKHRRDRYRLWPVPLVTLAIVLGGAIALATKTLARLGVLLADSVLIASGLSLGVCVRFRVPFPWHPVALPLPYGVRELVLVYLAFTTIWVLCFHLMGLYRESKYSASRALLAALLGLIVTTSFTFFARRYAFSRLSVLYAWGFNSVFLAGWRWVFRMTTRSHRAGRGLRRTLIVGTGPEALRFLETVREHPALGYEVVGFVGLDDEMRGRLLAGKGVLDVVDNLPETVRTYRIDEVIITTPTMLYSQMLGLVAEIRTGPRLKLLPVSFEQGLDNEAYLKGNGDLPLVDIAYRPRRRLQPRSRR